MKRTFYRAYYYKDMCSLYGRYKEINVNGIIPVVGAEKTMLICLRRNQRSL